jgi:PEP-CTERM motif
VKRRAYALLCMVMLASVAAMAGSIPFSGSGSSGTIDPGQPFSYDFAGALSEANWGVPGVGAGLATWSGATVDQFTITFDLAPGISIDSMNLGATCDGGPTSGTVFCASPYTQPWNVTNLTTDSITFTASPGGDLLINNDSFFINIFFTGGDPIGASFNGDWVTPVPEPGSLVLLSSGILAIAGAFRRKLLL